MTANDTVANAADALMLHPEDNVATALRPLRAGETVRVRGGAGDIEIALRDDIPLCHKLAFADIAAGAVVRKYGESIGSARSDIPAGAHVHVHNLASSRARSER